ncbi:MAG: N-6 DNA methylase [Selenomonadaceae bacterium]|nr:N-6 DNA methylase [Selenomonadaceae bacterium]
MLTEKNFSAALKAMNFVECGNFFEKTFADDITMSVDIKAKKLSFPAQVQGRERNNSYSKSLRENLVVFECVNRLLDKGYKPEDIELERQWQLGHSPKGGRADICVSHDGKVLFIIECKTFGDEFKHEIDNMLADGGQLFSYWQQEQSCRWLMLYTSTFDEKNCTLNFNAKCVHCDPKFYAEAQSVPERFNIWSERFDKFFLDDVIFHAETVAYKIGSRPLRKRYLRDIKDSDENQSVVNQFEEILRHNQVSDKENAFNRLTALFICKVVDEARTSDDAEVSFQFKFGADTRETFQDRLQKLYADGMKKFMGEDIFYLPEDYPDKLFKNFADDENHDMQIKDLRETFRRLKFYTNNEFAFVEVSNEKLFKLNAKILVEVVRMFQDYRIIGSRELQLLGDLFEQLLSKGFKQDEGQFFTPTPIAQFIWDSLPLDEIVARLNEPPKVIDYACGAGHFLTEGFRAVNDCFARNNKQPPVLWERNKLFGVEKDYRLARVSKVSLFMHGAGDGKIKFGDGLENYPDENISPATFDVLVANPPYSVKGFKAHIKLANEFDVLDKISNSGSEIETLFAERISQLVKPKGVAAVILPSSILNKDGKSFVAARESLLKKFFMRAIVQLGSKTFGATGTSTVVMFLERFDEPPRVTAEFEDIAETILSGKILQRQITREVFAAYTKKIGVAPDDYKKFIARAVNFDKWKVLYFAGYAANFKPVTAKNLSDDERLERNNQKFYDEVTAAEREKIIYFALTFRQTTLIVTAPDDNKEQEIFLGYGWSNAKGREGIVHKKRGGLLFDNKNRTSDNTIAAVIRAAFRGEQIDLPALEKYFRYATLSDTLNFDAVNFTKKITLGEVKQVEYSGKFPTVKLGDVVEINPPKSEVADVDDDTPVSFVEMASVSNDGFIAEKVTRPLGDVRRGGYKYFAEDDIIIAKITPCMENGKCAVARGLTNSIGFGSTEFHVFRCDADKILTDYLFVFLNREDIRQAAQKVMTGASGHRRVPETFYAKLIVPLPTLDVQKKIVVDFQILDAQIDSLDAEIQKLDADVQEKFNALFADKNFPTRTVNELFDLQIGRTPSRDNQNYWRNGTHKWISVGDLGKYDRFTGDTSEKISQTAVDETGIRLVPANTVIMSFKLTIGKTAITSEEIYTNEAIAAFIVKAGEFVDADYLRFYLRGHDWSRGQMRAVKGLTLNKQSIGDTKIPVPPLDLQKEFASYVESCEAQKQSARVRRDELLGERERLVTKYFR